MISDQVCLDFTGRINILTTYDKAFLGHISLIDGMIVSAMYLGKIGRSSLDDILIDSFEGKKLSFVAEAEIVDLSERFFELSFDQFCQSSQGILKRYKEAKRLLPSLDLKLLINPAFIIRKEGPISYWEFEVLSVISDFNRVSDIFLKSSLKRYQVILSLVELRAKGAIKVIG